MAHDNYPKGAGLGRDPNPRNPTPIDFDWTMQHGSRAQRREILRLLKMQSRQGVPGADEALRSLAGMLRAHRMWRVTPPGRTPFTVFCAQGATADEMLLQWPGAVLEVARGQ
ncbi:hypothetical protein [Thauera aromatica]|uniref:Uncharacterized protein n=1 Tax=Thauera aromatica K172 TaxID=44139 RepID=A0A2R4BQC4_THAAR|nr:hypothetical protein [Thauera aromatica]AVR89536.1 hypothetical protein Tharo_2648 [Thauera aromatica K172]